MNRAFPFWKTLSELQQKGLINHVATRRYGAGDILEKHAGLYLVSDGPVIVYTIHENGKRRVAFSAEWMESILMTPAFLRDSNELSLELHTRKASEICFVPYEEWRKMENMFPEVREYSMELLSAQMDSLAFNLYARTEKDLSIRIAMFLLRSYEKGGGPVETTIRVSHEELAEQIDATREAVTRNVHILKEAGLVQTGRGKITIMDPEGLRVYANMQPMR